MGTRAVFFSCLIMLPLAIFSQATDSAAIEKLRTESGVDPTRVQSRAGFSVLVNDLPENAGKITNRFH